MGKQLLTAIHVINRIYHVTTLMSKRVLCQDQIDAAGTARLRLMRLMLGHVYCFRQRTGCSLWLTGFCIHRTLKRIRHSGRGSYHDITDDDNEDANNDGDHDDEDADDGGDYGGGVLVADGSGYSDQCYLDAAEVQRPVLPDSPKNEPTHVLKLDRQETHRRG